MKKERGGLDMDKPFTMIVGATGFLGLKIADHLSQKNHNLILICYTNLNKARELSEKLRNEMHIDCYVFNCNIKNEADVNTLFQKLSALNLYVRELIFTAVNPIVRASIEKSIPTQWQDTIMTGIIGLYLCTRAVFTQFQPCEINRVIVISSTSAFGGMPNLTDYASVKSAQIGFAKSLALEGSCKNVRVNVIAPGLILNKNEKDQQPRIDSSPIKRLTTPEDVINVIDFLLSITSDAITGQVFVLDAGNDIRYRYLLE
jgi:3-oxoacyl-[acyl-carrier protein] reductase